MKYLSFPDFKLSILIDGNPQIPWKALGNIMMGPRTWFMMLYDDGNIWTSTFGNVAMSMRESGYMTPVNRKLVFQLSKKLESAIKRNT